MLRVKFNSQIQSYDKNLIGSAVNYLIDQPRRIKDKSKTLIDHIYSNNLNQQISYGILVSDFTNYFPIFQFISNSNLFKTSRNQTWIREMKNVDVENFMNDLAAQLNYKMMLTINDSIHRKFEHFVNVLNNVVSPHAPRKLATRKEKKIEAKLWPTFAVLHSIKIEKQNV